jgi:hypothetical protein
MMAIVAGMSDLVIDSWALPPPEIESHFGISRGHIHHMQNGTFAFDKRMPYSTPIQVWKLSYCQECIRLEDCRDWMLPSSTVDGAVCRACMQRQRGAIPAAL